MKKTMFVIALMVGSRVWAIAPLGPTTSTIEKGKSTLAFEYAHGKAEYTGKLLGVTVKAKAKSNAFFGRYAYGVANDFEVFGRLGTARLRGEDVDNVSQTADYEFAYGFGAKTTLAGSDNLSWGLLGQVTWWRSESTETLGADYLDQIDKGYTIQVATGPVFKANIIESFYGGPLLYFTRGDVDVKGRIVGVPVSAGGDIEQDLQLGGYVGACFDLGKTLDANIEYQFSADNKIFGVGLTYIF